MSDIGEDIRTYLLTKSAVTDIVSSRIFVDAPPQGAATPFIVYSIEDTEEEDILGTAKSDSVITRMELTCVADTRKVASSLDAVVKNDAPLFGDIGTVNSRAINDVFPLSANNYETQPFDGSDNWRYATSRAYRIFHADDP